MSHCNCGKGLVAIEWGSDQLLDEPLISRNITEECKTCIRDRDKGIFGTIDDIFVREKIKRFTAARHKSICDLENVILRSAAQNESHIYPSTRGFHCLTAVLDGLDDQTGVVLKRSAPGM